MGPSVPGSNGSRRNSNSGGMQTPCGNVTDSGTPSSTPSVPRRCSVGLDGTSKSNGRGNQKSRIDFYKFNSIILIKYLIYQFGSIFQF